MLIRIGHTINPRTSIPIPLNLLFRCSLSLGHVHAHLDSVALLNLRSPLLQRRKLGQVDLQGIGRGPDPREVGDVGDGVLRTGQERALLETRLEDRVQPLGLVYVPLDAVVGAGAGKETEVVGLAFIEGTLSAVKRSNGEGVGMV